MTGSLIVLSSIILFQLTLLAAFLFFGNDGKQRKSHVLLGCFFLWMALNVADGLLTMGGFYRSHPSWAHLEDGFIFLLGPVLLTYVRSMAQPHFRFRSRDLLHLLPFLAVTVTLQSYYHSRTAEQQVIIQETIIRQTLPVGFYFVMVATYLHVLVYLVFSFIEVGRLRMRMRQAYSSFSTTNLYWLQFMLVFIGVTLCVSIVFTFLPLAKRQLVNEFALVPFAIIFGFNSLIFWKAIRQPEILIGLTSHSGIASSLPDKKDLEGVRQELARFMEQERPYLDADLTLERLAGQFRVTPRKMSEIINESGQNFFDYINTYRIAEAKRLLAESSVPRLTIQQIMYQSGFNSKSSFNTVFRDKTGMTPTQYRQPR